ncbi:MAG: alpha-galactosidase [Lachnospiraceae bacterium]|jgi:alpha-galactosidase|nr:alpha-galactosidase [Lachnospiraceae bacterium]
MAICFHEEKRIFQLDTKNSTYLIGLTPEGYLGHIYYGRKLHKEVNACLLRTAEAPFTPSVNKREKVSFMDSFPMEYPVGGIGDYRESCLNVRNELGQMGCELLYQSFEVYQGKKRLEGLPASFGSEGEVETLEITLADGILGLEAVLSYSVFEKEDIIARSVRVSNKGSESLQLEKVYSACLDMDNEDFEMISLCGSWARERHIQREPLHYGKQSVGSVRGESSHQEHPFIALVTPGTTGQQGEVYAMHFVYSGNFLAQAEINQFDSVRMVMGIHGEQFTWNLSSGESFQAPEVICTYSGEGLGKMSRCFHDFYRNHMIRSVYNHKKRPVLINNWEATYFAFDDEKLLEIAREAKNCGIEMLVMDDGWFGKRNFDDNSLGDWIVNEEKIKGGLKKLVDQVNEIGLEFGIWFEPEMISPDSELYRAHPDWALQIDRREVSMCRNQYVLDLSRPEVVDYVSEAVAEILRSANIRYVKWDMNRQLTDLGSVWLDREHHKELFHRYVLGVYELQERLVTEFPELLLENCSGGGARFDPGMLYYSPQIWCSDDTDAVERLSIQEGTALVYPLSSMGAHISDCPNHITGRITPFETRSHVALAGSFGYELDITKIPEAERQMISGQVAMYHAYNDLVREGDYYRIASYQENHRFDAWAVASKDKGEVLVTYVQVLAEPNKRSRKIRLQGFDEDALYRLEGTEQVYSGEMLLYGGFLVEPMKGDFVSRLYHFVRM